MASRTRLPPPKKKKHRILQPDTADEYLAVGVGHEEAAEKWRAGDAVKGLRFYDRALQNYDQALALWPENFDVAYNKLLPVPLPEALANALEAHRLALKLAPENADVLFNTAQVLSALADDLNDDRQSETIALLEESVTHLQACLNLQSDALQEARVGFAKQGENVHRELPGSGESFDEPATPTSEHDTSEWARIEEPTTDATLLETATAIFDTLAVLSKALPSDRIDALGSVEEAGDKCRTRLESLNLNVDEDMQTEFLLADAKLKAAMLEAAYHSGTIALKEYDQRLKVAFASLVTSESVDARSSFAEALLDVVTAAEGHSDAALLRWNRTSKALELLAEAAQSSKKRDMNAIHMLRGDLELFRHRLTFDDGLPHNLKSVSARETLLQNAGKYYRGVIGVLQATKGDELSHALIKEALAAFMLTSDMESLERLTQRATSTSVAQQVLKEAVEELLVPDGVVAELSFNRVLQVTGRG
ncbi:MAG: hypothetical protein Q9162_000008 [Coniocarpon cinnabarinum]